MKTDLEVFQLGMARDGSVTLAEHQKKWAAAFLAVSTELSAFLKPFYLELHHIGSTSIPDIRAKPILDVLGVPDSLESCDRFQKRFEECGFVWKGEHGIPGRRYCVQYDLAQKTSYIHLHAFAKGHPEVERHLLFRDYLRAFPGVAKKYEEEKALLMQKYARERALYTSGKAAFIERVLIQAKVWSQARSA